MVNVTKSNFLQESNKLMNELPTAAFVALDLEMTGISLPTPSPRMTHTNNNNNNESSFSSFSSSSQKEDTPESRYQSNMKEVPERYAIIQVGIAIFHENKAFRKYIIRNTSNLFKYRCDFDTKKRFDGDEEETEKEKVQAHSVGVTATAASVDSMTKSTTQEEQEGDLWDHDMKSPVDDISSSILLPGRLNNAVVEEEDDDDSMTMMDALTCTTEPPEFLVSKYNFYLFPPASNQENDTREPTLNPSSIAFLNEHDMDYNLWIKQGIPYTTIDRAHALMDELKTKYDKKHAMEVEKERNFTPMMMTQKPILEPTRLEDIAFIARTMASLREWIDVPPPPQQQQPQQQPLMMMMSPGSTTNSSSLQQQQSNQEKDYDDEEEEELSFTLPKCNAFLRRCLYETISFEYPSLILEKAPLPNIHCIRVLRLSTKEKKERDERLRYQEWATLQNEKIGFTRVFEALSKACRGILGSVGSLQDEYQSCLTYNSSQRKEKQQQQEEENNNNNTSMFFSFLEKKKRHSTYCTTTKKKEVQVPYRRVPLIVHNGCMDLLFLLTHCHAHTLPTSFPQVKELITHYFPIVYDTKVLSSECSDSTIRNDSTALGDLFQRLCLRSHPLLTDGANHHEVGAAVPRVKVIHEPVESVNSLALHEAAFDAYMTGSVFHALSRRVIGDPSHFSMWLQKGARNWVDNMLIRNDGVGSLFFLDDKNPLSVTSKLFGKNKLFMMRSLYTIDLSMSSGDPFKGYMSPSTTFRVSKIEKNTTTRDIVNCLANLVDPTINSSSSKLSRDLVSGSTNNYSSTSIPGKVLYDLIWVNDETFLVSTRLPDNASFSSSNILMNWLESADDTAPLVEISTLADQECVLKRHAKLIYAALVKRFALQEISTLDEYLKQQQGMKKRKRDEENESREGMNPRGGRWSGFMQGLRNIIPIFGTDEPEKKSCKRQRVEESTT